MAARRRLWGWRELRVGFADEEKEDCFGHLFWSIMLMFGNAGNS